MAETTTGLRAIFSLSEVYSLAQDLVGARQARDRFVREFVKPTSHMSVLDIGCGPGEMVEALPKVKYLGVDHSAKYIEKARQKYGDKAEFFCGDITGYTNNVLFDCAIAFGVFHHLDDHEAETLLKLVKKWVRPGGRLITYDPTFTYDMGFIARSLVERDRGQNVRTEAQLLSLIKKHYTKVASSVHDDFLRIPYANLVTVSEI